MSSKELRRAGVLARVESGELKLIDAAVLMGSPVAIHENTAENLTDMLLESNKQ